MGVSLPARPSDKRARTASDVTADGSECGAAGNTSGMEVAGIKLIGVNALTGEKLLFSLALCALYAIVRGVIALLTRPLMIRRTHQRVSFWTRQGVNVVTTVLLILGLISIWFDRAQNAATVGGLVTAGLAVALQRVITAVAGYVVILRGKTFNVGDRIVMGGVRGDVIGLGFIQTTIMEMGQPPAVQSDEPAVWVRGRQFTGRIVTVSNATVFTEPVYNYSRDFPLIWEEIDLPIAYRDDRQRAEEILLDVARRHTEPVREAGEAALQAMLASYEMPPADLRARVFYRITDNWLELGLRFVAPAHGVRALKDTMSREILAALDTAGIGIASSTYDIVGFPPLRIARDERNDRPG